MKGYIDTTEEEEYYRGFYNKYGYSQESLGWTKGEHKHAIRFDVLTSQYDFKGKSVLDIGCGFGDLNRALVKFKPYRYLGIDIVKEFIDEGSARYGSDNIVFEYGNFLEKKISTDIDYVVASGIFNRKFNHADSYDFIRAVMDKAFDLSRDGLAFNFMSDKVNFQLEESFHSSPEEILRMAYKKTRNIMLRNDYMPFEFTLFLFKDDSFSNEDTVFNNYKESKRDE